MAETNAPEIRADGPKQELENLAAESLAETAKDTPEALLKMSGAAKRAESRARALREASYPTDDLAARAESLAKTFDALAKDLRADVAADVKGKMPAMKAAAAAECERFGGGPERDAKRYLGALADYASLERLEKDPASTEWSLTESRLSSFAGMAKGADDTDAALRALREADVAELVRRAKGVAELAKTGARCKEASEKRDAAGYLGALADYARAERLAADPASTRASHEETVLLSYKNQVRGKDDSDAVIKALQDPAVLELSRRASEAAPGAPAKKPAAR